MAPTGLLIERGAHLAPVENPLLQVGSGSAVGRLPLEWAFRSTLRAEAALVRAGLSFPIGASVVALARKPT